MKLALAFLFLSLTTLVLARDQNQNASSSVIRLPLPDSVKLLHPELMTEPINSEFDFVRIVGGVNAQEGEAPYQVALFRSGGFLCGGELIASQTVLTAAHCVFGYETQPSLFTIRYGSLDRTQGGAVLQVSQIIRHPNYSSSTTDNDVAILSLAQPFAPSASAQVIPLADSPPADSSLVTVTGWGRLTAGGVSPTLLQKANGLAVVNKASCNQIWSGQITASMLCAKSDTQSACNGDSGGPLTQNGVLVGVVSWGSSSCLHATYPNVYADVSVLKSWILANSF